MIRLSGYLASLVLLLLTACSAPQYRNISQNPVDIPTRATVIGVPFYPQEAYYCGPASLAMMLSWSGENVSQSAIAEQIYTPARKGTLPPDILTGARRHGVLAIQVDSLNELLSHLADGYPVLVFQNLGLTFLPRWHYAVAYAYDLSTGELLLHSGTEEQHVLSLETFENTWKRADYWAITVTQPDDLPPQSGLNASLKAANGLEQARRYQEAATAFRSIANRWQDNIPARMGLGNALYATGDYESAVTAFLEATNINPDFAPAWNNLAHVLGKLGQTQAAIAAAERAIALEENNDLYQETLKEIETSRQ